MYVCHQSPGMRLATYVHACMRIATHRHACWVTDGILYILIGGSNQNNLVGKPYKGCHFTSVLNVTISWRPDNVILYIIIYIYTFIPENSEKKRSIIGHQKTYPPHQFISITRDQVQSSLAVIGCYN